MTDNRQRTAGTTHITAQAVLSNLDHPLHPGSPPIPHAAPGERDPRALPPNNAHSSVTHSRDRSSIDTHNVSTLNSIRKGQGTGNAGGAVIDNHTCDSQHEEEGIGRGEGEGVVRGEGQGEGDQDDSDDDLDSLFPKRRKTAREVR